jgi:hypothetical protein
MMATTMIGTVLIMGMMINIVIMIVNGRGPDRTDLYLNAVKCGRHGDYQRTDVTADVE